MRHARSTRPSSGRRLPAAAMILATVLVAFVPASAQAQTIPPPFNTDYSATDLGSPPGVPPHLGGLTFESGDTDVLLIGGEANGARPARCTRSGHARRLAARSRASAATPSATRTPPSTTAASPTGRGTSCSSRAGPTTSSARPSRAARSPTRSSTWPRSVSHRSLVVGQFVPAGYPGAGSFKLASYGGGQFYDARVASDGAGTYNVRTSRKITAPRCPAVPTASSYVPIGSPRFDTPSMLVSEYAAATSIGLRAQPRRQPDRRFAAHVPHRPQRRRRRHHRPGHRRLPLLDVRRRQQGDRRPGLRPAHGGAARRRDLLRRARQRRGRQDRPSGRGLRRQQAGQDLGARHGEDATRTRP